MKTVLAAGACALLLSGPVLAHHSAAGIDRTKSVTLVGTLKQFSWSNPHSWMELEVPNDKGTSEVWTVEMTSPTYLARAGWKSTSVKVGEKLTVVVRPLRNGDPGGLFVSVTTPSGQVLTERAAIPPAAAAR